MANNQTSANESIYQPDSSNMAITFPKISLGTPKALADINKGSLGKTFTSKLTSGNEQSKPPNAEFYHFPSEFKESPQKTY